MVEKTSYNESLEMGLICIYDEVSSGGISISNFYFNFEKEKYGGAENGKTQVKYKVPQKAFQEFSGILQCSYCENISQKRHHFKYK